MFSSSSVKTSTVVLLCCCRLAYAQLDFLTIREAESLVEQVPEVAQLSSSAECPVYSVSYLGEETFVVQVRAQCGTARQGQLVGAYYVDRRTGTVRSGESGPSITSPSMEKKRAELVRRARARTLSADDAACLAVIAVQVPSDASFASNRFSIEQLGRRRTSSIQYSVQRWVSDSKSIASGLLSVSLTTARVRDDNVGIDAYSEDLGRLQSALVALRMPGVLSPADTGEIVRHIPTFAGLLNHQCIMTESYYLATPEAAQVGLVDACTHKQLPNGPTALVNVQTGAVTDPKTGAPLTTPESQRFADEALARISKRQQTDSQYLDTKCKGVAESHPSNRKQQ